MNRILLLIGLSGFLTQCRSATNTQANTVMINQEFKLVLNQQVMLWDNERAGKNAALGKIKLVHLEDSRCPAHATCIWQGAVVTTLTLETPASDTQTVRLFIGDKMTNDNRGKRNVTADTIIITLKEKVNYQLILKTVLPYPGTSDAAPQATLLVKKP